MGRESVPKGVHARGVLTNGQLNWAWGTHSYTVATPPRFSEAMVSPPFDFVRDRLPSAIARATHVEFDG